MPCEPRRAAAAAAFFFALIVPMHASASCIGDCDGGGDVTVDEIVTLVTLALDGGVAACVAGDANSDGSITVDEIITAVSHALGGCPAGDPGLGVRRFSLSGDSRFELLGLPIPLVSNNFNGHLEFDAGPADAGGIRPLHLVGASDFIDVVLTPPIGPQVVVCIQPVVEQFPLRDIGFLACDGTDLAGLELFQDHNISDVDPQCLTGTIDENPFHEGVCNGPTVASLLEGPSGPGAAAIAPDPETFAGGLPVNILIETALPCGDEAVAPIEAPFALNTVLGRATVLNAGNIPGSTLTAERTGVNFDCSRWTEEDGPGTFVLLAPLIDFDTGVLGRVDGIIAFSLAD